MAAGTMATAAGAAVVLYYVLSRRLARKRIDDEDPDGDLSKSSRSVRRNRLARRPAQAPATLLESIVTLTETLRFTYTETLGKWPIGDLAFSINYFMRKQGNLPVASVYAAAIKATHGELLLHGGPNQDRKLQMIQVNFMVEFVQGCCFNAFVLEAVVLESELVVVDANQRGSSACSLLGHCHIEEKRR
ncbi:hypothetical protein K1719_043197 [Acacia pycnantha]|nr:hypothetical protein K1719_043197 [Acacia pycnantha]